MYQCTHPHGRTPYQGWIRYPHLMLAVVCFRHRALPNTPQRWHIIKKHWKTRNSFRMPEVWLFGAWTVSMGKRGAGGRQGLLLDLGAHWSNRLKRALKYYLFNQCFVVISVSQLESQLHAVEKSNLVGLVFLSPPFSSSGTREGVLQSFL